MRLQHLELELFADYHQFYLWDRDMNPVAPVDYNEVDVCNWIKTNPHVLVVLQHRDGTVRVEVEIHDSEPGYSAEEWDHIAEASLHLPTGNLQVHECTGGVVADIVVKPGWYRVRTFHGGFDTIDESELEGDDETIVVLWPAPSAELRVIKQWLPESEDDGEDEPELA